MEIKYEGEKGFNYKIYIIGTGGTGSQLLPFVAQLANRYNASIVIVDGDAFDTHNVSNQKCLKIDQGRTKVEVLCERYQFAYPDLNISFVDAYLKDVEQLRTIIPPTRSSDKIIPILIGCVDNNATRKVFDSFFYDDEVPDLIYIDSGNGTNDRFGQVVIGYKAGMTKQVPDSRGSYDYMIFRRVKDRIIYKPVGDMFENIREDKEDIISTVSCTLASEHQPQNIATNILAAATIFCALNNIIAFDTIGKNVYYFDAQIGEIISREVV